MNEIVMNAKIREAAEQMISVANNKIGEFRKADAHSMKRLAALHLGYAEGLERAVMMMGFDVERIGNDDNWTMRLVDEPDYLLNAIM